MNDKDIEINTRLMTEFGLEQGSRRRVYDHETGDIRTMKGKEIVAPGAIPGRYAVEFDPMNNSRMMNFFFGNYIATLEEEDLLGGSVLSYSTIQAKNGGVKAVLKINPDDGGPIKEIHSKAYNNETSCYADLVCRINGDETVDMTPYDYDRKKAMLEEQKRLAKLNNQKLGGKKK